MRRITIVIIAGLALLASSAWSRPSDFGKQWVRNHPFQVYTWYTPDYMTASQLTTFSQCNFSGIMSTHPNVFNRTSPAGMTKHVFLGASYIPPDDPAWCDAWLSWIAADSTPTEDNAWYIIDEPNIGRPGLLEHVADVANYLRENRPNGLVYLNVYGTQDAYLTSILDTVHPDALSFDCYPYVITGGLPTETSEWFPALAAIANKTKSRGIPFFSYVQAFAGDYSAYGYNWRSPSESETRMLIFSALAAGAKGINYYQYCRNGIETNSLIDANGSPTNLYSYAQAANPEIKNLGKYLRFLQNVDYRFVPGAGHTPPVGWTNWAPGAGGDPHITGISVNTSGNYQDGMIGFFNDDVGNHYFMLTNLLRAPGVSAVLASLGFTITFDSGIDHVYRIRRDTGVEERVDLVNHQLNYMLPGGTGDLYSYTHFNLGYFTVSGNVMLAGYDSSSSRLGIRIEFMESGGVVRTEDILLNADGSFSIQNVVAGTYDIAFKSANSLRKIVRGVSVGAGMAPLQVSLTNGDLNGDNEISATDLSMLLMNMDAQGD